MARKRQNLIGKAPSGDEFILTFDGISLGIIGDSAFTVEEFKNVDELIRWTEHKLFFFEKCSTNLAVFLEYLKKGKVRPYAKRS